MVSDETIRRAARALWDHDNADQTPAWRDMAWADMGGPEPDVERAEYELRAQALASAGLLAPDMQEEVAYTFPQGGHRMGDAR